MLTREQILARKTGEGIITFQNGDQVRIRQLTRDEVMAMQDVDGLAAKDSFMIACAMIEPKLTPEEVAAWAAADSAGDLIAISDGIAIISGLKQGAEKSNLPAA